MLLCSCNREDAPDCFKSAGPIEKESRSLAAFDRIEVNDLFDIELVPSDSNYIVLEGPKNVLPKCITEVSNGVLHIRNDNTCNFVRSFKQRIEMKIHLRELHEIQNRGTGNIFSTDTLRFDYLKVENRNAAGQVDILFVGDSIAAFTQTGVADIRLEGSVFKAELFNQGFGSINAHDLKSEQCYINNSSINDISAYCNGYLFVINYFSGKTEIFGSPDQADVFRNGSGPIIIH